MALKLGRDGAPPPLPQTYQEPLRPEGEERRRYVQKISLSLILGGSSFFETLIMTPSNLPFKIK